MGRTIGDHLQVRRQEPGEIGPRDGILDKPDTPGKSYFVTLSQGLDPAIINQ